MLPPANFLHQALLHPALHLVLLAVQLLHQAVEDHHPLLALLQELFHHPVLLPAPAAHHPAQADAVLKAQY